VILWVRAKKRLLMTKVKIAGTAIAAMFLMSSAANAADHQTTEKTCKLARIAAVHQQSD